MSGLLSEPTMLELPPAQRYQSVQSDIVDKTRDPKYNMSPLAAIMKVSDKINEVFLHQNKNMSQQEKKWLGEKLAWESLFPNEKSSFPGKRPKNPKSKTAVRPAGRPCSECKREGLPQDSEKCPFVELGKCHRRGHGEYKFRLGSSEFLDPKCPVCFRLKMEARSEGWEML